MPFEYNVYTQTENKTFVQVHMTHITLFADNPKQAMQTEWIDGFRII